MNESHVQGSAAWKAARLGKITASRFSDVLTQPKTKAAKAARDLSKTAESYMLEVVAEILTGQDQGAPPNWAMKWGNDNEPGARMVYEEMTGQAVEQVGFLTHETDPMIGGSPDGLVGENGGIEIKCPANTANHLAYRLGGELPKEHVAQVQGHLWLANRDWWDFVSYDPRIKDLDLAFWRWRVKRDETYITNLESAVFAFRNATLGTLCQLKGDQS